jgi:DNA segregation ATPase FtsK/SpoIIIE-like protein
LNSELQRELAGTALVFAAVFVAGALLSRGNPEAHCWAAGARFGPIGSCVRATSLALIGPFGAALLPLLPLIAAASVVRRLPAAQLRGLYVFIGGLAPLVSMAVALLAGVGGGIGAVHTRAGYIGALLSVGLAHVAGVVGTWLILLLSLYSLARVALLRAGIRVGNGRRPASRSVPASSVTRSSIAATRVTIEEPEIEVADPEVVVLPSSELLLPALGLTDENMADREATAFRIVGALRHLHLDATVIGHSHGPAVTRYEVEISPSTPVRDTVTLARTLATALRVASVRIAPMAGRVGLGIEVPKASATPVSLRGLIESAEYLDASRQLPVALGRDLGGNPVVADLAKMPHLLIAGASGSGKSVCLGALITSLLYRHSARSLRLLVIDTDEAGLAAYDHIPHLWGGVITDYRAAAGALESAIEEMRARSTLLVAAGARNLQEFNQRVANDRLELSTTSPFLPIDGRRYAGGALPHLVVVIDDLSALLRATDDVAQPLSQLAARARSVGIHIVAVTQRVAPDTMSPALLALFPARVALRVDDVADSAALIERSGAEALVGPGDLLFLPPGRSEPVRLQAPLISAHDTRRIAQWFAEQSGVELPRFEPEPVAQEAISQPPETQSPANASPSNAVRSSAA